MKQKYHSMKQNTRHRVRFPFATLAGILMSISSGHAATLQVDIQNADATTGNPLPTTQSGWTPWATPSSFTTTPQTSSFDYADATDGTVGVTLTPATNAGGRNYGIDNVTSGTLAIPNVWADLYFFNSVPGTLTITFSDLKAGTYSFTSYHYADNLGTALNHEGTASVLLDTGTGFTDTGEDVTLTVGLVNVGISRNLSASQVMTDGTFTTNFTVANDNDPISIRYQDITGGNSFGINGFELAVVPEPSSSALLGGFGLLTLLRRRRAN